MKTMILFIALTGFTAAGSYAQNKDCACRPHIKLTVDKTAYKPPIIVPRVPLDPDTQNPTCFMLRKENLGIPGCMDVNYAGDNSYVGYYSRKKLTNLKKMQSHKIVKMKEVAIVTPKPMPQVQAYVKEEDPAMPCYTYRQHNIVVKQCPDAFYDSKGLPVDNAAMIDVHTDNTYMGNYPKAGDVNNSNDTSVPEIMDRDKPATTSPGDNLCFWNCR